MIYVLGGGAPLNYKVVGGTSAPSNPKENTIWVNTSTAITRHVFSATQPKNLEAGMIWFQTDAKSAVPFNALKKNNITVYPLFAKQYVSGSLVNKTAKIYQGGKWVEWWKGELYDKGNEWTNLTGGWAVGKGTSASNYTQGTVKKNTGNVEISISGGYNGIAFYTKNKIDLSKYSKLKVSVTAFSNKNTSNTHMYLMVDTDVDWSNGRTSDVKITSTGTFTLDISSLNSSYYVSITGWAGVSMSVTIDKIWLE